MAKKRPTKGKLINALNRIDELACMADVVQNNDNGEAQKLEKDYNMIFDFLSQLRK